MCLACLEYIKGNLRLKEFKTALREYGREDSTKDHVEEVQTIMYDHKADEDSLKLAIQAVQKPTK